MYFLLNRLFCNWLELWLGHKICLSALQCLKYCECFSPNIQIECIRLSWLIYLVSVICDPDGYSNNTSAVFDSAYFQKKRQSDCRGAKHQAKSARMPGPFAICLISTCLCHKLHCAILTWQLFAWSETLATRKLYITYLCQSPWTFIYRDMFW